MGEKLTVLNLRKKIKKYIKKPILINWMNENLKLISRSDIELKYNLSQRILKAKRVV